MVTEKLNECYQPAAAGQSTCFRFEDDFVEENVRCIPMIVRFKLDICGIKLKLGQWSKLPVAERITMMEKACVSEAEIEGYHALVNDLVQRHTGEQATPLPDSLCSGLPEKEWIPAEVQQNLESCSCSIHIDQWKALSNLQRFALVKLSRPGHENKNFPRAIREFGLLV